MMPLFRRQSAGRSLSRTAKRSRAVRRPVFEEMERRWVLSAATPTDPTTAVPDTPQSLLAKAALESNLGQSIDAFGLDLYAQLQSQAGGNLFMSPFSAAAALAMTYAGAQGETAQQMADVLHFGSDPATTESEFGSLLGDLNAAGQSGGFVLNVANALWVQQGIDLLPEFVNVMQADFGGNLNTADFASAAEAARQTINNWVSQQTNGKIQNLFPVGSLDMFTKLALVDAVYFKGQWSSPFDASQTSNAPFTLASGDQVAASMMHQTGNFRYMQSDGFQVLELPYANGRLAMDVLLPTQAGLSGIDSDQLPADLPTWLSGLSDQDVAISLPKFQMTTGFDLRQALQSLGMADAFSPGADFSEIADSPPLNIQDVFQKAFISVDETGTQAAAATGISVVHVLVVQADPTPPIVFNADHPFLFLIRDTQSNTVLFMGQVENPNQQGVDPTAPVITHQAQTQAPQPTDPVGQDPVNTNPPTLPPLTTPPPSPVTGPIYTSPGLPAALSADEKLVDTFYHGLLNRAAEPAALAYWSSQLDGGASPASVVSDIESSDEFRDVEVESLYHQYLDRAADPAGLAYFSGQLATGGTVEQVAAALAGSLEFYALHGGAPGAAVNGLFLAALGRAADAPSIAFFEQELAAGDSRRQIAAQVLSSDEYQRDTVDAWLASFPGQSPNPTGATQYASELHAGIADSKVLAQVLLAAGNA